MGTYLNRTPSSAGNRKTMTFSCWVKRSELGSFQSIISAGTNGATYSDDISFQSTDKLMLDLITTSGRYQAESTALFRDPSAWYHIVIAIDTTAASNRMLVYVNNEQVAVNSGGIPQNQDITFNNNTLQEIGRRGSNSSNFGSYYLTDFNFIDGQALTPSTFGETDSTTGEWKPKVAFTGVTYGTNGFRLQFGNAAALGTDTSGQSNNFTVNNAGTNAKTVDTASNNFATINPVAQSRFSNQGTISLGNLKYDGAANDRGWGFCSMGVTKGKWYWEIKATATDRLMIGVGYQSVLDFSGTFFGNNPSKAFSILSFNGNLYYDGTNTSYGPTFVANDIIMVALDMDNYLCWFGKNGTWSNNATQTEIENATATNDATTKMGTKQNINNGDFVFPFITAQENAQTGAGIFNFGNPPFTISSGNADANGHGNFEYAVPSGYYSLCTKNINQYG